MKKKLLKLLQILITLSLVGMFSVFVFGQGYQPSALETNSEFAVRLIGWATITGAGLTYIALNIYNAIRGKNYEQLKEALVNYKELAESRKAQNAEKDTRLAILERELERRDLEDERRRETELRK
jgi:hypothetical protein